MLVLQRLATLAAAEISLAGSQTALKLKLCAHRLSLNELLWGDVSGVTGNLFNGSYTATQQLNAQKTLLRPMLFAPGEQYCYTNSNFNLAAYVVEKVWPGLSKDACLQHRLGSTPRPVHETSAVSLCQHMHLKHASCHVAVYREWRTDSSSPDTAQWPFSFGCVQCCVSASMPTPPGCSRRHAVGADLCLGACSSPTCPSPST